MVVADLADGSVLDLAAVAASKCALLAVVVDGDDEDEDEDDLAAPVLIHSFVAFG